MEDKLKNIVDRDRAGYDVYRTDYDSLWENVSRELDRKERNVMPWIMRIAAGLVFLALSTLLVYTLSETSTYREGIALYQVSPEMKETEQYYIQLISERMAELSSYPEIEQAAENEVAQLDSLYADLRKDLADNIDNEEVVSAMIQTYRLKLEVLENILHQIRQKNDSNESDDDDEDVEEFFL